MAEPATEEKKFVMYEGEEHKALADGNYDVIILGTGLKETMLSGMLAVNGMKVLHIDRNGYYGGETASLNITNLYKKFVDPDSDPPAEFFKQLGENREYNVDIIPKFIMANGNLVKMLIHSNVTHYLDFKNIAGSFVLKRGGKCCKVPATEGEALRTGLLGFFQKRKLRNFLQFIARYDEEEKQEGEEASKREFDIDVGTMRELFDKFGLDENTQEFVGHAMALRTGDEYMDRPARETVDAIGLYAASLERYGTSPYIYPMYGLGGLAEAFSRLCAVHGGTFMLNRDVKEMLFNKAGEAVGIKGLNEDNEEAIALAPMIIGEPSYFPKEKVVTGRKVIRSICILDHPVKAVNSAESAQIIIPQSQVDRENDIYVSIVSYSHRVCDEGKYIAIASTTVETEHPALELEPAIALLEPVLYRFDNILESVSPVGDGMSDRCFITESYDATSHFETTSADVLRIYERVTGTPLDMSIRPDMPDP